MPLYRNRFILYPMHIILVVVEVIGTTNSERRTRPLKAEAGLNRPNDKVKVEVVYALYHPAVAAKYGICNAQGKGVVEVTPKQAELLKQGKVLRKGWFYVWLPDP